MVISFEHAYLGLLARIKSSGEDRADRTGVGTRALFGEKLVIDLANGFPILTTKLVAFNSVLSELLWFIEGSGDERRLAEILHKSRTPEKKTIWAANAEQTTGSRFVPQYPGDLGRIYGVQWRHWTNSKGETTDQLAEVISKIKSNPTDRRLILTAWNPGELNDMALPPCHMMCQFYVDLTRNELSCQMYQRSVDAFLGLPYNISSYALLTHMIANVTGLNVGRLIMVLGDTHIYKNHFDQVSTQLTRKCRSLPSLKMNRKSSIDDFIMEDFKLENYEPDSAIKAPMAS